MKKYIIIYSTYESYNWFITEAESPKHGIINLYRDLGSNIMNDSQLKQFADTFPIEAIIRLFKMEHYKIMHIGEYTPVYSEET